jgi:PAS domain S-box-containing protein
MGERDRDDLDARRFRALSSNTFDLVTEVDSRGLVVYRSPNHLTAEGRGAGQRVAMTRIHPEDRKSVATLFTGLFGDEHQVRAIFRTLEDDGDIRWIECTGTRFETADGDPRALLLSRNITESRQMQQRLRASRERFQLIAENAYDMIIELDAEGEVLYANARVSDVLGTENDRWIRFEPSLIHPDDLPQVTTCFDDALAGGAPENITFRVAHSSGGWRSIEASHRPAVNSEGEPRVVVIGRDISDRLEGERRLVDSEERYRGLVESSPLGIVVVQEGVVAFANPIGARICGAATPAELIGTPMVELVVPEQIPTVMDRIRRAERGESIPNLVEVTLCGLDGQLREVVGSGKRIRFRGAMAFQGVVSDATALRRAERERTRLELQLQEARKLESLGLLAGGIAHDFNNLLAVILGNVRFAQRHRALDPELAEALQDVVEAGDQAARLTQQLLAYAGRRSPEVRTTDLSELVNANAGLLGSALPRTTRLELELAADLSTIRADVVQLEQVLMNLVINAGEAIGDDEGQVCVRTAQEILGRGDGGRFVGGTRLAPGDYVHLEVEDTGRGMDASTRERIFEPFFSTKRQGHGLGLAAVVGLVHGHGGAVEVSSEPGEGTRIRVVLPALGGVEEREPPTEAWAAVVACRDPAHRRVVEDALRVREIEPLVASGAGEARGLLRCHASEVGLAVCDASDLFEAGGPCIATALRAESPGLALLMVGGQPGDPALLPLMRGGPVETLPDPLDEAALSAGLDALQGKLES